MCNSGKSDRFSVFSSGIFWVGDFRNETEKECFAASSKNTFVWDIAAHKNIQITLKNSIIIGTF